MRAHPPTTGQQLTLEPIVLAKSHSFSDPTGLLSDRHRRIEMFLEARVVIFTDIFAPSPRMAASLVQARLTVLQKRP